ncbi:alpha/beta hydrolase [Foetidibacter luteolus]|uniref:alpha/beta hydrolase n=1 Tax=Foetidibacter luteolus TaxID=2608880 RepID=UPI00129B245E|nr:alpha/beta hydrolase [Foetidibacter luteolus]
MKVYFLSGLGADERAFSFLQLDFCEPVFLKWIEPLKKESLEHYAQRIAENIPGANPAIVGLSFGGMLATEIAKLKPQANVVLLSSSKTYKEIPGYLRMWRKFPLYNWAPDSISKTVSRPFTKAFNSARGAEQKQVFNSMLNDTNMRFDKWAVDAIVNWKNTIVSPNIYHIHGDKDRMLPYRFIKPDYTVPGGTHLMVMNNWKEISELIKKQVS